MSLKSKLLERYHQLDSYLEDATPETVQRLMKRDASGEATGLTAEVNAKIKAIQQKLRTQPGTLTASTCPEGKTTREQTGL